MIVRALLIFILVFSGKAFSLDGNEENKLQEKALILAIDNGKDSPEIDLLLEKEKLKPEEMDYFSDDEIED